LHAYLISFFRDPS